MDFFEATRYDAMLDRIQHAIEAAMIEATSPELNFECRTLEARLVGFTYKQKMHIESWVVHHEFLDLCDMLLEKGE
jgi:hypothetical protein